MLADGRALLLLCCRAQQLYDSASGTFSLTGIMTGIYEDGFASALPPAGKVLVTGGYDEEGPPCVSAGACLYDSATGTFAATGNMETPRYYHTATTLGDGTVLIAGGYVGLTSASVTASAEIYDPAAGTFAPTGDMTRVRVNHTATLLLDGTVLIADGSTTPAEIYHPVQPVPAPVLFSLGGDAQGQGAIWHAATGQVASADNPAIAGEALAMYTTSLVEGGVIPPQVVRRRPARRDSVLRRRSGLSRVLPDQLPGSRRRDGRIVRAGRAVLHWTFEQHRNDRGSITASCDKVNFTTINIPDRV